jgi:predicted acetyltransferase
MRYTVRPITADELVNWVDASHVAFHVNRPAEAEARHRLEVRHQDLSRSLAALDDNGRVAGTYFSFTAELTLPGAAACVPTDAVTAVAVLPTHRRRGLLRQMMTTDLRAARERGEVASILIAAEYPIYSRFGFGAAVEQCTYQLSTTNAEFLRSAPGQVDLVSSSVMRELAPPVFDAFRRACPGQMSREPIRWDVRLGLKPSPNREPNYGLRCAIYTPPGGSAPTGYVMYSVEGDWQFHVPTARLEIQELIALDSDAYLGLWRYCSEVDLVGEVTAELRRVHEPLPWLLADARKALRELHRTDFLWLRALDTPRLLQARRYVASDRLVLEIEDPLRLAGGRFALEGGPDGASCRASTETADLQMSMTALGAIALGGNDAGVLATAGLIEEHTPGSIERLARMFHWPEAPWCSTFF